MQKVGILTVINCDNNGTDIQAYAMQKLFEQVDSRAELINYRAEKWEKEKNKVRIKDVVKFPLLLFKKYAHQEFRKKHFRISHKQVFLDDLNNLPYEMIIVGSDQIWNLDLTEGDLGFFLPYRDVKYRKYSYAVSMGRSSVIDWEKKYDLHTALASFEDVSVREETAVRALKEIGINARQDLDPVLMLEKKFWDELAVYKSRKKYILLYLAQANKSAIAYAEALACQEQFDIIWITDSVKMYKNIKCKRFVGVESWIGYVKNAELVITNSYHGLAMSVELNTPVCVFELDGNLQSNRRMLDLIDNLDLRFALWKNDRTAGDYQEDWSKVNDKLALLRKRSMIYIQEEIKI